MSNNKQEILFGSGDLFVVTEDATGKEVETKVGESNGEATLNIEYESHDVRGGAKNHLLRTFITSETITFNAGIVTYDLKTIGEFLAAKFTEDETKRKLELGGNFTVPIKRLRFVHYKEDGKTITLEMHKAQNITGLEWNFNSTENSPFEFEFRLMKDPNKNNIVEIVEEI